MGRRNGKEGRALIIRIFAAPHDPLLYKLRQSAAYRRTRTEIQKKNLFQCERLVLLFRISELDDNIEIDDRLEKWQL
ncbi:MAG: hypothetical protein JWN13_551 [Betaproteobacteria bacterium]|nr:hypothetical protein [Betaproteobacteria bacterium]